MGYTAQIGGAYNVEGSFNDYFNTQISGAGLPSFMPSAVVNFDYPNQPLTFPSFSVTHLGAFPGEGTEGRNLDAGFKGQQMIGLAQIGLWDSYQRSSGNQVANLRIMRDMAARLYLTGANIPILDVYGSTSAPTSNGTLIRASAVETVKAINQDPENPDVWSMYLQVQYSWYERITAV